MAHRIVAINSLRPRLKLTEPVGINEMAGFIAGRTSINRGTVWNALDELQASIIHFNKLGMAVTLQGIGVFSPKIGLDGNITIQFRQNKELKNGMETHEEYVKTILNKDNVGKTPDELIALWNEQNPTDPVEDPAPTP